MAKNPKVIAGDSLAEAALRLMEEHSITALFVSGKNKNNIAGVIHLHDLIKAGVIWKGATSFLLLCHPESLICHPELGSGSERGMLKQVQHDSVGGLSPWIYFRVYISRSDNRCWNKFSMTTMRVLLQKWEFFGLFLLFWHAEQPALKVNYLIYKDFLWWHNYCNYK